MLLYAYVSLKAAKCQSRHLAAKVKLSGECEAKSKANLQIDKQRVQG